jgi:transcriptional regulator PpsR
VRTLRKSIGALDADAAVRLVALATDIAVMVDEEGVVRDLSVGSETLSRTSDISAWVGQRWIDTVTVESRPKIEQLLRSAGDRQSQWRQVNHPTPGGKADLPVRYATMKIGERGRIMALGRELRSMSILQQKLVEAQQAMEREYARVRFAETRYRLLFQMSDEPVIIVDASNLRVTEINPAAQRLIGPAPKRIVGRAVTDLFASSGAGAAQRMLDQLRTSGKAEPVSTQLHTGDTSVSLSGSLFRHESTTHLLLKLSPASSRTSPPRAANGNGHLVSLVDKLPDALVVTDTDRRVLVANASFLDLAQLVTLEQAKGRSLDQWIGRSTAELNILIDNLREHGAVRNFATVVRGDLGMFEDVEISGVAVEDGEQPCYGLTLRSVGRRTAGDATVPAELVHSASQLKALVGQVPLKSLVRETTDIIERMCIEAALQMVDDNRASAAEMLGLSRQSLYEKLRRYGIGDSDAN